MTSEKNILPNQQTKQTKQEDILKCWNCGNTVTDQQWCEICSFPIDPQLKEEIMQKVEPSISTRCWRCKGTTSGDICSICGSPLTKQGLEILGKASKPDSYEKSDDESKSIIVLSPKHKQFVRIFIDHNEINQCIGKYFTIVNKVITEQGPEIIIQIPQNKQLYNQLESEDIFVRNNLRLLLHKTQSSASSEKLAKIQFFYWEPEKARERFYFKNIRWKAVLLILSLITITLTGWLYYRKVFELFQLTTSLALDCFLYTITLSGILGAHELAHIIMQRKKKISLTYPYFLPLPPTTGLLSFFVLGSAGGFVRVMNPVRKRDDLFDLYFIGPSIGLIVSIGLFLLGSAFPYIQDKVMFTTEMQNEIIALTEFDPFVSLGKGLEWFARVTGITPPFNPEIQFMFPHPITNAAIAGIIINGLNFLPGSVLDGGFLFRSLFGGKYARIFSFLSALLVLINYNTWMLGIVILFIPISAYQTPVTNEVLRAHWSKYLFGFLGLLIAFASLPIPRFFF